MGDYLLGVKGTLNNMGITDIGVTIAPRDEIVSLRDSSFALLTPRPLCRGWGCLWLI